MKQTRQRQEPFMVKRSRMKDTILKCKEIINNYSELQSQLKKNNYEFSPQLQQRSPSRHRLKTQNYHSCSITEHDLMVKRVEKMAVCQMKEMIKKYKIKQSKDTATQMLSNGLAVQKIDQHYAASRHARVKTQYQGKVDKTEGVAVFEKKNTQQKLKKVELKKFDEVPQRGQKLKSLGGLVVQAIHPPMTLSHNLQNNISRRPKVFLIPSSPPTNDCLKTNEQTPHETSVFNQENNDKKVISTQGIAVKNGQKQYLYERLANMNSDNRKTFNPIYERRIKSFCEFLWKIMLAHNVYMNLDLKQPSPFPQKLKAYVGIGNNCNMIKGLLRRRFWWTITNQYDQECLFAWTQLKINKIFRRQESKSNNHIILIKTQQEQEKQNEGPLLKKKMSRQLKKPKSEEINYNKKIWNSSDCQLLQPHIIQILPIDQKDEIHARKQKQHSYLSRTKQILKNQKQITIIQDTSTLTSDINKNNHNYYISKPIVHNHLQNNFFLGNKKALFHNLKQYYTITGRDPFHYIPLTFHIKHGFKDIEYKRFVKYHQKRNQLIKEAEEEEEGQKSKYRNIWIVKPGENTNRGRGITVIDEIYELDNIMKKTQKRRGSTITNAKDIQQPSKTFIVQMYIDRPFLYNERKFDIRHYMLITNIYGVMRAYWYDQGYIRTSSYLYDVHDFDPSIHLTNDAIQVQYMHYGRYEQNNKISYSQFQSHLNSINEKKHDFKKEILPKMKEMATDAAKSVFTKISPKNQMHNFQIFGLDFMIDSQFKPWLIEINTNPCLDCSCPLLNRIIPYMVQQSLKLSLDVVYPPPSHYPNSAKHYAPFINMETFKYQLIFDSLTQGEELKKVIGNYPKDISFQIGEIDDDQVFKDNGEEITLEDYT